MKILMMAHYVTFPSEGGNSRFCYLLNLLKKNKKNDIELLTSDFRHGTKRKHNLSAQNVKELGYKVTFIQEPGYKKNISLKRLYSAKVLARNTRKYLNSLEELPDVIYCAVPSLDIAKEAAIFARKNGIRFIVDIQDLWPEAFRMAINIPIVSDIVFSPMKSIADYIYKSADEIVAVSQTYVNRGLKVNTKANGLCVFLGTDLKQFNKNADNPRNEKYKQFTLAYIGTLGYSYDLRTAIKAVSIAKERGANIKFLIMGDGPLRKEFELYAEREKIECEFTGKLAYKEMCFKLSRCHIAINPIVEKSAASIINKVGDYAIAGLPVVNTQKCNEYIDLIEKYQMGSSCHPGDYISLGERILYYCNVYKYEQQNWQLITRGATRCGEERFDRKTTYKRIVDIIEKQP